MYDTFDSRETYIAARTAWRAAYAALSLEIRTNKSAMAKIYADGEPQYRAGIIQSRLASLSRDATEMMGDRTAMTERMHEQVAAARAAKAA